MTDGPLGFNDLVRTLRFRKGDGDKYEVDDGREKRAYDFQTSVIYVGYTGLGVDESGSGWTIKRISLDGSGNPTTTEWTGFRSATWDNRAMETYT